MMTPDQLQKLLTPRERKKFASIRQKRENNKKKKTRKPVVTGVYKLVNPKWCAVWDPSTHNGVTFLYCPAFLPLDTQSLLMSELSSVNWKRPVKKMFNKVFAQPRDTMAMVPQKVYLESLAKHGRAPTYHYSGVTVECEVATAGVECLFDLLNSEQKLTGIPGGEFGGLDKVQHNMVLLNRYLDGKDSVDWHADDEKSVVDDHPIDSVSVGATRRFEVTHKKPTSKALRELCLQQSQDLGQDQIYRLELVSGSWVRMGKHMQRFYSHRVPKQPKGKGGKGGKGGQGVRINLTFRQMILE
jgi:alkylated DNA repair dioxygenase AlkB